MPFGSSPRVRGTHQPHRAGGGGRRFIPACAGNSRVRDAIVRVRPVHPRVCGELPNCGGFGAWPRTSSPRVRGTPPNPNPQTEKDRFIPACAGNSPPDKGKYPSWTVHPRVCGELPNTPASKSLACGSSPRVRGTHILERCILARHRFIPACAGNSRPVLERPSSFAVHPRVCGELPRCIMAEYTRTGSSPRVRGTHLTAVFMECAERFIPACAGNSYGADLDVALSDGSSPRVRGTRRDPARRRRRQRFIPACAGNSAVALRRGEIVAVHPRVCGELSCSVVRISSFAGSSPRVRGTRGADRAAASGPPVHPRVCGELALHRDRPRRVVRFIPACAGNSDRAEGHAATDHGSSPRVRGTRRHPPHHHPHVRFIPACAGNSSCTSPSSCRSPVHPRVCGELLPTAAMDG